MPVTQYIGARYVPLFADPSEWSNDRTYEPLTIVVYQGNSYTSKQYVPVGIDIANENFWVLSGNYNGQVEAYRREVESIKEVLPFSSFDSVNTVEAYINRQIEIMSSKTIIEANVIAELDTTGEIDCTTEIQDIIDNAPIGCTINFREGTYLISGLELKSGINYDFGNSIIKFSGNVALHGAGVLKGNTFITSAMDANAHITTLNNTGLIDLDSLLVLRDETELSNPSRSYYYKGFTTVPVYIDGYDVKFEDCVPYNIKANTCAVSIWAPFVGSIKNIKNFVHTTTPNNNTEMIYIEHGRNVIINNVHFTNYCYTQIRLAYCHSCLINNCTSYYNGTSIPTGVDHNYFIVISSSTATLTKNCKGSNTWHCWTTGSQETPLNNIVSNCHFYTNEDNVPAVCDHDNAIGTIIVNSYIGSFGISAQAIVSNCIINSTRHNDVYANPDINRANYIIDNCVFINTGLGVAFNPQTEMENNEAFVNTLIINNCIGISDTDYLVISSEASIKSVTISNCKNILFGITQNFENLGFVQHVMHFNCTFEESKNDVTRYLRNGVFEFNNCKFLDYSHVNITTIDITNNSTLVLENNYIYSNGNNPNIRFRFRGNGSIYENGTKELGSGSYRILTSILDEGVFDIGVITNCLFKTNGDITIVSNSATRFYGCNIAASSYYPMAVKHAAADTLLTMVAPSTAGNAVWA